MVTLKGTVAAVSHATGDMTVTRASETPTRQLAQPRYVTREALGAAMLVVFIVYGASCYVAPLAPAWQAQLLMLFAALGCLWQDRDRG